MNYESRYEWSGEKARRGLVVRRLVGITPAFIVVGALLAVATLLM